MLGKKKTSYGLLWLAYMAFVILSPIVPGPDVLWGMVGGATGWQLLRSSFAGMFKWFA